MSTLLRRYWDKVDRRGADECWEWTAARTTTKRHAGHGVIRDGVRNVMAHRLAWELANGAIPAGNVIHHLCGNPGCQNPAHLQSLTHGEHTLVTLENPRIAAHHARTCLKGHPVEGENAEPYFFKGKNRVKCRICSVERRKRAMAAYKERQRQV